MALENGPLYVYFLLIGLYGTTKSFPAQTIGLNQLMLLMSLLLGSVENVLNDMHIISIWLNYLAFTHIMK